MGIGPCTYNQDAAQRFGATDDGRRFGNLSTIACTSFIPSKPLGRYGDGCALFTNDDALATVIREIARHGQDRRYHHVRVGLISRLDNLQAAILLPKLDVHADEAELLQEVAHRYDVLLATVDITAPHNVSAWARYPIRVSNRESVEASLRQAGIPAAVHYPTPLDRQRLQTAPQMHR